MFTIRRAHERGHARRNWLDSRHTFSFGDYYDPDHMGFGSLRVINDDRIAPSGGFGTHPHRDMEILTYVVEGAIAHRDSMGNGFVIKPGEVQRMTAGTGVTHSEMNPSADEPVRLLQIWIVPERTGLVPGYEQKSFAAAIRNTLCLVADRDGHQGAVKIHQNARVYAAALDAGTTLQHPLDLARQYWLQVVRGDLTLNEQALQEGDGVAILNERSLALVTDCAAEVLLFDLQRAA